MEKKTLANIFSVVEGLYPDVFEEIRNKYPFTIPKNMLEYFSKIIRDSKEKHFFQFLISSFDNLSERKNSRDLERLTDQLLKALPYFRLKVILYFPATLTATQRSELETNLNLTGKYLDPTFGAKIVEGSVEAHINTSAHTLFYDADTFSNIFSEYNLTEGSISQINHFSCTLNLNKYNTHIGSHRISIFDGLKSLTKSIQQSEAKLSSQDQALKDLTCLCEHFSLNPKIFLEKWNSTHSTVEDYEHPPHVWLQRKMIDYFTHFESTSMKNLLAFGFIGDICKDMSEWMKKYSHYHPSSLLSAWFDAKLNSFPGFELPLGNLFSQALNIDNDTLVDSNNISPEENDLKLSFYKKTKEDQQLSWLNELKQQFGSSDKNDLWLFHGTSLKDAESIVEKGVRLTSSKERNDLGKGFYTTEDFLKAGTYAHKKYESPLKADDTLRPCVMAFKVNTSNWIDCSKAREFIRQKKTPNQPIALSVFDREEFLDLIKKCRNKNDPDPFPSLYKLGPVKQRPLTQVDIVIAPLAIDGGESTQHCFRTEKVCTPLIDDLKFIVIINTQ